jgi:mannose-6-phosphate isomerase-like protein (cupin superfamily)
MSQTQEAVKAWSEYLQTVDNWEALIEGIEPKVGGCGLVYELPNPIERPNESFAIADMRELELSEPHKHINGETEVYFVIQGMGKIAVGGEIYALTPGTNIVTPPDTIHITLPTQGLVLAVVNTPPFELDNYVVVDQKSKSVTSVVSQLRAA